MHHRSCPRGTLPRTSHRLHFHHGKAVRNVCGPRNFGEFPPIRKNRKLITGKQREERPAGRTIRHKEEPFEPARTPEMERRDDLRNRMDLGPAHECLVQQVAAAHRVAPVYLIVIESDPLFVSFLDLGEVLLQDSVPCIDVAPLEFPGLLQILCKREIRSRCAVISAKDGWRPRTLRSVESPVAALPALASAASSVPAIRCSCPARITCASTSSDGQTAVRMNDCSIIEFLLKTFPYNSLFR